MFRRPWQQFNAGGMLDALLMTKQRPLILIHRDELSHDKQPERGRQMCSWECYRIRLTITGIIMWCYFTAQETNIQYQTLPQASSEFGWAQCCPGNNHKEDFEIRYTGFDLSGLVKCTRDKISILFDWWKELPEIKNKEQSDLLIQPRKSWN